MRDRFREVGMQAEHGAERPEPIKAQPFITDTDRIRLVTSRKPLRPFLGICWPVASHTIIGHHIDSPCANSATNNHSGNSHILLDGTILTEQIGTSFSWQESRWCVVYATRQNVKWNVRKRHDELTKFGRFDPSRYCLTSRTKLVDIGQPVTLLDGVIHHLLSWGIDDVLPAFPKIASDWTQTFR